MKKSGLLTILLLFLAAASFAQTAEQLKKATELFKSANAKMDANQYAEAIKDWDQFLAIRKDYYGGWYNRALSNYYLMNYLKAIPDFTEAIRLKPDFFHSWNARGDAYRYLSETNLEKYGPLAVADYTRAVTLDPKAGRPFKNRGIIRSKMGQYDLAIRDFNGAIFADPKDAESHFQRGVARFHKGDLVGCDADFQKTLALDPKHPLVKEWIEFRKGKPAVAAKPAPTPAPKPVTVAKASPKPVRTTRPDVRKMNEIELREEILSLLKLTDEPGKYAERIIPIFEGATADINKQKAMQAFVIGYFGWKARVIIRTGVGKFSLPHMVISRGLIGFYDDGATGAFTLIINRAEKLPPTNLNNILQEAKATDAEQRPIKDVTTKYLMSYIGSGEDYAHIGSAKFPPVKNDKMYWQILLGAHLGEIGGEMFSWYRVPTSNKYHVALADSLLRLEDSIAKAPADTPPVVIAKLRKLSAHGNKDFYNEADRQALAAALREALFASFAFAGMDTTAP